MDLRKSNCVSFLSHNLLAMLLVIFSFLLFYYFKLDFITEWDSYGYLIDIHGHFKSSLFLGRFGFISFFMLIWELCSKFYKMPILNFYHVIIFVNLIFSSLTILLVYLITKKITRNKLVGFGSALILIFSKDFIRYAGNTLIEPMMIFMTVLSFFLFITAINKKNLFCFYLSAFIFGYAFEVKEAAILSILFFPAFLLTKSESKYFTVKNYLFFILIFLETAFIMPFYWYLKDRNKYIYDIVYYAQHNNRFIFSYWQEVYNIMKHGFGILLLPLMGLIILLLRKKFTRLLLIITLFIPNIIFSFYGDRVERYFVFGYISLSILTAYCFYYIVEYFKLIIKSFKSVLSVCFLILLILWSSWNFTGFYNSLINDKVYSKYLEEYGLRLLYIFPENTVFILGDHTALMDQYYIRFNGSQKKTIWPGWTWPHEGLRKVIENYLSCNKRIIIDFSGFIRPSIQAEKQDILKLLPSYKVKILSENIIELYK